MSTVQPPDGSPMPLGPGKETGVDSEQEAGEPTRADPDQPLLAHAAGGGGHGAIAPPTVVAADAGVVEADAGVELDGEPAEEKPPSVVAVVISRGGSRLDETLRSLAEQDYPDLTALVVDAGAPEDLSTRVLTASPGSFVRRLDDRAGFAAAANTVLGSVEGAAFLLFSVDDVAFDPPAVRLMVEEAYRSNAGVVGPKIVDAANPGLLMEVGRSIDRFGGPHTGIEPGERDQEQHDAIRDVFYVSGSAMLVRADLFGELGGFDPLAAPGSEDLDLCWRARVAGARVLVVPDARVSRPLPPVPGGDPTLYPLDDALGERGVTGAMAPDYRGLARGRIRTVLTCYSGVMLAYVVPLGVVVSVVEAVAFALTRRRDQALAEISAWFANLLRPKGLRNARRRAQKLRAIHDYDLHELQDGAMARARAFLAHHRADERIHALGEAGRGAFEGLAERLRHPASMVLLAFLLLIVWGSRDIFTDGTTAFRTMPMWPSVGTLFETFTSAWRYTGLGSATAAPPGLVAMGLFGSVLFGAVGTAQTLVVVLSFFVGALGVYRIARSIGLTYGPGLAAALVYGINPVAQNSVALGELGSLVLFALGPWVALLVLRVARFDGVTPPVSTRRTLLNLVLVTAVLTAWYPPALLFGPVVAGVLLLAAPFARGFGAALRGLMGALLGAAGAAVLLLPWATTFADAADDRAAFGLYARPAPELADVLRFHTGPVGTGLAGWGLVAAGVLALAAARGPRLGWTARAWLLAAAGFAITYLPGRLDPDAPVPAPETGLVLAAMGLAIAIGLSFSTFVDELRKTRLGSRQVVAVLASAGLVLGALGFLAETVDGRWDSPASSWDATLAFMRDQRAAGAFRVLWLGDPTVLPLDPVPIGAGLAYTLTRDGPGDARELWRAPVEEADAAVSRVVRLALDGRTGRIGRLLAPLGVRYVALASRIAPDTPRVGEPAGISDALAEQLDLVRLGAPPGLVLYDNAAWAPARAVVDDSEAQAALRGPLLGMLGTDLSASAPLRGRVEAPATILLAEAFDRGWHAEVDDREAKHERAAGTVNGYAVTRDGEARLWFDGQTVRWLLVFAEAVVWSVLLVVCWRGRRRKAAGPWVRRSKTPRERPVPPSADGIDFWESA